MSQVGFSGALLPTLGQRYREEELRVMWLVICVAGCLFFF